MTAITVVTKMTVEEAQEWKSRVGYAANHLRHLLNEGYERSAWEPLGYANWTDCVKALAAEFELSERRLWQLHAANETEQLLNHGSVGEIPERQLRPLTQLPPETRVEAFEEAKRTAPNGKMSSAHVGRVAQKYVRGEFDQAVPDEDVLDQTPQYEEPAIQVDEPEIDPSAATNGHEIVRQAYDTERQALIAQVSRDMWGEKPEGILFPAGAYVTCPKCKKHHKNWVRGDTLWLCMNCDAMVDDAVLAALVPEAERKLLEELKIAPKPAPEKPVYDGDEWCTPAHVIDVVRELLGRIDVDPASNEAAQQMIQATLYYTKETDGLLFMWPGKVWLNPPYSFPKIERFTQTLTRQYDDGITEEAVLLVNNCTDADWFQQLLKRFPVCFTDGRIKFEHPERDSFQTRQGQAFFYLGPNVEKFTDLFERFGTVVEARRRDGKHS